MDRPAHIVFSIKAVKSHRTGLFIRRRRRKRGLINLKSFIETKTPCVFTTKLNQATLRRFENLRAGTRADEPVEHVERTRGSDISRVSKSLEAQMSGEVAGVFPDAPNPTRRTEPAMSSPEANTSCSDSQHDSEGKDEDDLSQCSSSKSDDVVAATSERLRKLQLAKAAKIQLQSKCACTALLTEDQVDILTIRQLKRIDCEIRRQLKLVVLSEQPDADFMMINEARKLMIESGDFQQYLDMTKIYNLVTMFMDDVSRTAENRSQTNRQDTDIPQNACSKDAKPQRKAPRFSKRQFDNKKSILPIQKQYTCLFADLVTPEVCTFLTDCIRKKLNALIINDIMNHVNKTNPNADPRVNCGEAVATQEIRNIIDLRTFYNKLYALIQLRCNKKLKKSDFDESLMAEMDEMIDRMKAFEAQIVGGGDEELSHLNSEQSSDSDSQYEQSVQMQDANLFQDLVTPEIWDLMPKQCRINLDELIIKDIVAHVTKTKPHVDPMAECRRLIATRNTKRKIDLQKFYYRLNRYIQQTCRKKLKKSRFDPSVKAEMNEMIHRMKILEVHNVKYSKSVSSLTNGPVPSDSDTKNLQIRSENLFHDLVTPEVYRLLPGHFRKNLDASIVKNIVKNVKESKANVDAVTESERIIAAGDVIYNINLDNFYKKVHKYIRKIYKKKLRGTMCCETLQAEMDQMIYTMKDFEMKVFRRLRRERLGHCEPILSDNGTTEITMLQETPAMSPGSSKNIPSQDNPVCPHSSSNATNELTNVSFDPLFAEDHQPACGTKKKHKKDKIKNKYIGQQSEECASKPESKERNRSDSDAAKQQKKGGKDNNKLKKISGKENFENYITFESAISGLAKEELVKGIVRINPKNFKVAYVNHADSREPDYIITSLVDRNRALEGDEVVLKIKPESEWIEGCKTAKVVYILKKVHPRTSVGRLVFTKANYDAEFYPRDQRFPIVKIPRMFWPPGFDTGPELYEHALFSARLVTWNPNQFPGGILLELLGETGNLRTESLAILKECSLDITPFPPQFNRYLPQSEEIPEREFTYRLDLRDQCIFTIDPLTARDLDDAMSCRKLPNGNYEIGVHISDAAFFLTEDTPLDQKVCERGTTVYLVDQAYHMLPVELCLHCSLLPGKDKLAFSVIWEMTEDAEVVNTKFAKSIINSCAQLAYEHAQKMIEHPVHEFSTEELPVIHNGFTPQDLSRTVNTLQAFAVKMRERRLEKGALKLDQIKLSFVLDPVSGKPLGFSKQETKDANRLIEEFMLLANISVAEKIYEAYPNLAFLRCHEQPKIHMLMQVQKCLETFGMFIDMSSSKSIRVSMEKYQTDDYFGHCRSVVFNHLFTKPMVRARYFCSGDSYTAQDLSHYALSVPIYTHFTSPIRRYADIMVHRLLAASLGYTPIPRWHIDRVSAIAANCNNKKYLAKKAGEASSDLYLMHYINEHQPCILDAVVVDVKERAYDVLVLETGSIIRMYFNKIESDVKIKKEYSEVRNSDLTLQEEDDEDVVVHDKKIWKHTLYFPKTKDLAAAELVIEMFAVIRIAISKVPKKLKLEGKLLRPVKMCVVPELLSPPN